MKTTSFVIMLVAIILFSMLTGYIVCDHFNNRPVKEIIIPVKDMKLQRQIDSLIIRDSLLSLELKNMYKKQIKYGKTHENISNYVDTMSIPTIFRELSKYYTDK